jgi:hypothetical protein
VEYSSVPTEFLNGRFRHACGMCGRALSY